MKIRLLSGDLKGEEQALQMPAWPHPIAFRDNRSVKDFNNTPHGVPAGGSYTVDCSYDGRLINSLDLNLVVSDDSDYWYFGGAQQFNGTMKTCAPPLPGQDIYQSNVVPLGYVLIVRRVGNVVLNNFGGNGRQSKITLVTGTVSIMANGSEVKGSKMPAGWSIDNETWALIDEGQTFTISYNLSVEWPGIAGNSFYYSENYISCNVYAHLVQKAGAPLQFTAANQKEGIKKVVVSNG